MNSIKHNPTSKTRVGLYPVYFSVLLILSAISVGVSAETASFFIRQHYDPGFGKSGITFFEERKDYPGDSFIENRTDYSYGSSMWAYADHTGAVRLNLKDGSSLRDSNGDLIGIGAKGMHNTVEWEKFFTKGSGDSKTTATILPSSLSLWAAGSPDLTPNPAPFIAMSIDIEVAERDNKSSDTTVYKTVWRMSETIALRARSFVLGYKGMSVTNFVVNHYTGPQPDLFFTMEKDRPTSMKVSIPKQVIKLDLSKIKSNGEYLVTYKMHVYGAVNADQFAEANFGDPVKGGGILIESTDTPFEPGDSGSLVRRCTEEFDSARFSRLGDGTVTDNYYGLTWQRCPVGYSFSDNGTAANMDDDRCAPLTTAVDAQADWQSALQSAESNALAGLDWRLPNVKELESLLEASCTFPTIDTLAFPDSIAGRYWTSTPSNQPGNAWQVDFASGDTHYAEETGLANIRLVRDSGVAPINPLPALRGGYAEADEGDNGTTQIDIPVYLDKTVSTDVTVDYQLVSDTATEGGDFVGQSGTLTFPAGTQRQVVTVTINGDTDVESNETVDLQLSNSSANVRIAIPVGVGRIMDDEPAIQLPAGLLQQNEGNTGDNRIIDVPVTLSKAAVATISVEYATEDGSALAGSDYTAASGTLVFNPGEIEKTIPVVIIGNGIEDNERRFALRLSNPLNGAFPPGSDVTIVSDLVISDDDGAGRFSALNDTAYIWCADTALSTLSCPQAGYPNQDGDLGRDVTHNDNSDGRYGFSFTKLDSSGTALVDQAQDYATAPWDCVRDEVTGLYWEVKTPMADSTDLRSAGQTFTWYNADTAFGTENGGVCADSLSCDTEKYVTAMNAANLCGFNDWRLPTVNEVLSISTVDGRNLGRDGAYFPNLGIDSWTSARVLDELPAADALWRLYSYGMRQQPHGDASVVRLVRGGQRP